MGMPQLVVTAVLVEGRSKSEVAREYGVSRRWVITLVQRYLAEGDGFAGGGSRKVLVAETIGPQHNSLSSENQRQPLRGS